MTELSAKEQDLLQRVQAKPELRPLFFRKVRGLRWFDALDSAGYFDEKNLPKPVPAREEGYVSIPRWEIAEYLTKTAPELAESAGAKYAPRFLEIMRSATLYATEQNFSNYQTWWKFSETISQLPPQYVPTDFIDIVDHWLNDEFDRTLVSEQIGHKWLVKLLDEGSSHSLDLAAKLLDILYKLLLIGQDNGERKKVEVALRFDQYRAERITKSIAQACGRRLGARAVGVFQSRLEQALGATSSDRWSSIWQPAIEEHAQNKHRDKTENILVEGYRDCLIGYFGTFPDEARDYVGVLLSSAFETVQRVAIYCITEQFSTCNVHVDRLLDEQFLHSNFRHEFWQFMNRRYAMLQPSQKEKLISLINQRTRSDESGVHIEGATAYEHAIWFSAIKDFGKKEADLYKAAVNIAKAEPEHPDFASYMSVGWAGPQSPYSVEELGALSVTKLAAQLAGYKERGGWREPGIEGLSKAFKGLLKASPTRYYPDLAVFSNLDLAYVYAVIEAYNELWQEKASLPWSDIWPILLNFCSDLVRNDRFWNGDNAKEREFFVANRHWVVRSIGRLLEAGAKSDEHAFDPKHHSDVEALLALLLSRQEGEEFKADSDAVSIAINSPRGVCIEALLNLTLRSCRLADRQNKKDHSSAWKHFEHYYDSELRRANIGEHEFSTLVTNYLPNFLYLSREWVNASLTNIFNAGNYLQWLCAVQGYSYVGAVYQDIYAFLRDQGHFIRMLDDVNLKEKISEKVVQNAVVAYLNDFESLGGNNSLVRAVLERRSAHELGQLIWFVWTIRDESDAKLQSKVYELWPAVMNAIDISTKSGKRLASSLCHWSVYLDKLDADKKALLMTVAPYADYSHNSYILLQSLANLSKNQPFEVNEIWLRVLEESTPEYPEEAIHIILTNLVLRGEDGKRMARNTVSEYLKRGSEAPSRMLREILRSQAGGVG